MGGVEENLPDPVPDLRAPGLPGENVLDPGSIERVGEQLDLRRLSGSLDSLERDERAQGRTLLRRGSPGGRTGTRGIIAQQYPRPRGGAARLC
jgi:hypothetical protein